MLDRCVRVYDFVDMFRINWVRIKTSLEVSVLWRAGNLARWQTSARSKGDCSVCFCKRLPGQPGEDSCSNDYI